MIKNLDSAVKSFGEQPMHITLDSEMAHEIHINIYKIQAL